MPYLSQRRNTNRELLGYNHKTKPNHFHFQKHLSSGSNQKNVKEIDSTKGFVKYSMKFSEDFHNKTKSRTAIHFDKTNLIN
jgi:hypothetical protein